MTTCVWITLCVIVCSLHKLCRYRNHPYSLPPSHLSFLKRSEGLYSSITTVVLCVLILLWLNSNVWYYLWHLVFRSNYFPSKQIHLIFIFLSHVPALLKYWVKSTRTEQWPWAWRNSVTFSVGIPDYYRLGFKCISREYSEANSEVVKCY